VHDVLLSTRQSLHGMYVCPPPPYYRRRTILNVFSISINVAFSSVYDDERPRFNAYYPRVQDNDLSADGHPLNWSYPRVEEFVNASW
jgi:hypothetical protein